jgi:hypothetical protein
MRRQVPYSTGPCLPVKVGSGATTCPVAPNATSLLVRAPTPSCVLWLRTLWEGFSAPRVLRLWILPPYWEDSRLSRVSWFPVGRGPQT